MPKTLQDPAAEAPVVDAATQKERLEYFGGTPDDIDSYDATGEDDGSDLDYVAPEKSEDEKSEDEKSEDEKTEGDKDGSDDAGDKTDETDGDKSKTDSTDESSDNADDDSAATDQDDETPASEGEGEDEDSEKPKSQQKIQGIPKHRFDQVNDRAKAAEAEIARRDALVDAETKAKVEEYDFDEAEREYQSLTLDGKTEEAVSKRKEIRAAEKADWKAETRTEVLTDVDQSASEKELNDLGKQAEGMFPVFDENHEDFDAELTSRVMVYYQGYMASGKATSPGDAFVMGLADVIDQAKLEERYGETEETKEEGPPEPPPKKKTEQKKKLADQAHTPIAGEGKSGEDAGVITPDLEQMSEEDFDALPASRQAQLRGDFM